MHNNPLNTSVSHNNPLTCAFHQNENLTNFCLDRNTQLLINLLSEKCLLPLCPTCVKIHTIQHIVLKTSPQYQHINTLIENVLGSIKQNQQLLNQDLMSIHQSQARSQTIKQSLVNNILSIKQELIRIVEEHCQGLIQDLSARMEAIPTESPDLDRIKKSIAKNLDSLKVLEQSLYLDKPMRSVIKYLGKQISQKIKSAHIYNETYIKSDEAKWKRVYIDVFPEYPASFKNFLKAFLSIKNVTSSTPTMTPQQGSSKQNLKKSNCDRTMDLVDMSICDQLREVTNNYQTRRISITDSITKGSHQRSVRGSEEKPHHNQHGNSRTKGGLKLTAFDEDIHPSILPMKAAAPHSHIRRVSFNKTLYLKNKQNQNIMDLSMRMIDRLDQTML